MKKNKNKNKKQKNAFDSIYQEDLLYVGGIETFDTVRIQTPDTINNCAKNSAMHQKTR